MLTLVDKLNKEIIREEIEYKVNTNKDNTQLFVVTDDESNLNKFKTFVVDYKKTKGLIISRFLTNKKCYIVIEDWFKVGIEERYFLTKFLSIELDIIAYVPCFYNNTKKDRRSKYEGF